LPVAENKYWDLVVDSMNWQMEMEDCHMDIETFVVVVTLN